MNREHFTVLGVARPRAGWFADVGRWATSAALPADFVRCVSVAEVHARLLGGRPFSALLVDHRLDGLDRDLFDTARRAGCAVVVVDDGGRRRPWAELGADAVLDEPISADALLATLRSVAEPVERLVGSGADLADEAAPAAWHGRLVTVTGAGGSGTSSLAAGLAQALGTDPSHGGRVALLDAALDATQAILHDTGDVVPGLQELVEAHRTGRLDPGEVAALTWPCEDRGYDLVLGLRRHRDWTALRPRAVEAAVGGLRRTYAVTVADVDPDLEGEAQTGSFDVEDRNVLARHLTSTADVVLVTATPSVVGVHRLVRTLGDLLELGVAGDRVLPVVNRAPRSPRARAEVTRAVADLLGPPGQALTASPLFIPARRELDGLHRDVASLPKAIGAPLARAVAALLERADQADDDEPGTPPEPVPITPGSLGEGWS